MVRVGHAGQRFGGKFEHLGPGSKQEQLDSVFKF